MTVNMGGAKIVWSISASKPACLDVLHVPIFSMGNLACAQVTNAAMIAENRGPLMARE